MAKIVLLVPGFQNKKFNARSKMEKLADRLEKEGWTVYVSDYGHGQPMKESIIHYAAEVAKEIEQYRPDVIIVHSMGGLVVRWSVEIMKCGYPGLKLIILETPHQGLPLQDISLGRLVAEVFKLINRLPDWDVPTWRSWKDMIKGSDFLRRLNESDQIQNNREGVSYYEIGGLLAFLWHGSYVNSNWQHFYDTFFLPRTMNCPTAVKFFPKTSHSGLKTNPQVIDYIVGIINT